MLMVLVAVCAIFCAWLAWERSVVMERRAFLVIVDRENAPAIVFASHAWIDGKMYSPIVSWLRGRLGDAPIAMIKHSARLDDSATVEAARLFPEAHLDPSTLPSSAR